MTQACIPKEVVLSGIAYKVTIHENAVIFSWRCGPSFSRMMFERKAGCWYVSLQSSDGDTAMVSHIQKAYDLVTETFGGNHDFKNGEYDL